MMLLALLVCTAAAAPSTTTVIEHVRVEVGDGTVLENAVVTLDKGRITRISDGVPQGVVAPRIDGTGKTLTPGLIETRSLMGVIEVEEEESTHDFQLNRGEAVPAFRAGEGFNPASLFIARNREDGITSGIVTPTGRLLYGTGGWFDLTGLMASRASLATPIAMFGGVGTGAAEAVGGARGGVWLMLREIFDDARWYQRNRAAFDRGDSRALVLRPNQLAAMLPVLDGSLPLVLDCDRASDILTVLEFAAHEKIRVVISGGAEAWQVAPQIAAAKVPVIFKPMFAQPNNFEQLASRDDSAALLNAAGVELILSAGHKAQEVHRLRQEAGMAVAYGLPRDAALKAITLTPAKVFGKAQEVGTVAVGKRANVVLWSGDPLETTTLAEHIWIDGEPQSMETRQLKLARRYKKHVPVRDH